MADTEIFATIEGIPVIEVEMANPIYRGPKGEKGDKGDSLAYKAGEGINIAGDVISSNINYLSNSDILNIWNNIH